MEGKKFGDYTVLSPLGQGTFGQTWLVEKGKSKYALKIFKNEMIKTDKQVKRIDREIESLRVVKHPNVVRYVGDGYHTEGYDKYRFLVMEYADGEPLRTFIERNGRLTVTQTQRIGLQILDGIRAIHDAGFYHRDLKPDNIFVTRAGDVRILDFGLVKFLDASTLTATGDTMGTYAYMPPEQLKDSKNIDHRADLYSFGAIVFHMITGRIPLEITNLVEAPFKILNEIPPFASSLNPAVPNRLDNLIATLLEKEVHRRKYNLDTAFLELRSLDDRSLPSITEDLTPRFLPRLLHNERSLVEDFNQKHGMDGIIFPANFFPKYRLVYDHIRDTGGFTIIDPVVYRLAYSKFSNTKSLIDLPYCVSEFHKEKPEDFQSLEACAIRAKQVVDWQLKQNPSAVVAPFHFLASPQDPWLDVDLKIFNECKKYLADLGEKIPLYFGVSTHIESLADPISPITFVNKVTRVQADGYMLMFDANLDSFNRAHYYAFGKFVSLLGEHMKPIVLSRVNDFGFGLMAFGATAISSGIGYIEDFKESILIEESGGYNLKPKYYIPKLLTSFSEKALKDIFEPARGKELACFCPYCEGSTDYKHLLKPAVAKGHYLWQKTKQIQLISEMQNEERLRWFVNTAEEAKTLLSQLKKDSKSKNISYDHFQMWIDSLVQLQKEQRDIALPSIAH